MENFSLCYEDLKRRFDNMVEKRFPADTTLEALTFLNDKSIDGELYAIFQSLSVPIEIAEGIFETLVLKKSLPTQKKMCEMLHIKSVKTYRAHLNYLIDKGYIEQKDNGDYVLPNCEDIYLKIPLETVEYLTYNCREHVIKIYIYLMQRWKYAKKEGKFYKFTLKEIGEHIGLKISNHTEGYKILNYALELLVNSDLVEYEDIYEGKVPYKMLTGCYVTYKKGNL